jgi:hypothetical protein
LSRHFMTIVTIFSSSHNGCSMVHFDPFVLDLDFPHLLSLCSTKPHHIPMIGIDNLE